MNRFKKRMGIVFLFIGILAFFIGSAEANPWRKARWSELVPSEDRFGYERNAGVWQVMIEKEYSGIDVYRIRMRWTDPIGNIFTGQSDGMDISLADRPYSLRITDVSGVFPDDTTAMFHGNVSKVDFRMVQAKDVPTYIVAGTVTYISGMETFFTVAWDHETHCVMKYGENILTGQTGFRWADKKSMELAKDFRDAAIEAEEARSRGIDSK